MSFNFQVIPTVGVEGENGEKNLRSMLKHFRNLVDENASKANFLAAFKGKPELNRQESGISSNCSELVKSELEERESTAELDSDLEENISKQDGAIKMEERIADGNTISDEDVKLEGKTFRCVKCSAWLEIYIFQRFSASKRLQMLGPYLHSKISGHGYEVDAILRQRTTILLKGVYTCPE